MAKKVVLLILVVLTSSILPVTALAAEQPKASEVFAGYSLTITDTTTPAVDMSGRTNDPNTMCFRAVDGRELGSISYADYNSIISKYKIEVPSGGGTQSVPPDGSGNWHVWFAKQFNMHRGLNAESAAAAQSEYAAKSVEEYRQEIIRLTNEARAEAGLSALTVDEDAMAYAQIRAEEISTNFSHDRLNGEPKEVNGDRPLEIITGGNTPQQAFNSWMASTGHRNNILNADAYAFGVGAYQNANGFWYWTQEFLW